MICVVMGVAGAGKTTVGEALSKALGWPFYDADHFHSPENVAKMAHGIPLQDADRWPWLEQLRDLIQKALDEHRSIILACSALKNSYRAYLEIDPQVRFVFLKADRALLLERLRDRKGHYMKADLLGSQLQTLEEPANGIAIDASLPVEKIVEHIRKEIQR